MKRNTDSFNDIKDIDGGLRLRSPKAMCRSVSENHHNDIPRTYPLGRSMSEGDSCATYKDILSRAFESGYGKEKSPLQVTPSGESCISGKGTTTIAGFCTECTSPSGMFCSLGNKCLNKKARICEYTEDRSMIVHLGDFIFSWCADGHGGYSVAEYVTRRIASYICSTFDTTNIILSINEMCEIIHEEVKRMSSSVKTGSTLVFVCVDKKAKKVYVANLGDSRCVIVRGDEVVFKSEDLDTSNSEEIKRINTLTDPVTGTSLFIVRMSRDGAMRLSKRYGYVFGNGIIPTAGFGDYSLTIGEIDGIRRIPVVSEVELLNDDVIILASDGLFDSPQKINQTSIMLKGGIKPISLLVNDVKSGLSEPTMLAKHIIDSHIAYIAEEYCKLTKTTTLYGNQVASTATDNKSVCCIVYKE
jgi:serine/threonine protein phosphatase PrpC